MPCSLVLQADNRVTSFFFFFNDTATTEIYTLSLHDALPICRHLRGADHTAGRRLLSLLPGRRLSCSRRLQRDRKSTRLNSSHLVISYAVFCLKKKKRRILGLHVIRTTPPRWHAEPVDACLHR